MQRRGAISRVDRHHKSSINTLRSPAVQQALRIRFPGAAGETASDCARLATLTLAFEIWFSAQSVGTVMFLAAEFLGPSSCQEQQTPLEVRWTTLRCLYAASRSHQPRGPTPLITVDIDSEKIMMAKQNAAIYGVLEKIEFVVGDFFKLASQL
ncbi:unnamed protein product [Macrosiphum euphorbiae]|uniref:Trimethylguanosine synthase n=1 Tax=Macrosiphum euphorbiae TaxID=13131 RepID=A0AAV0XYV2_9HEMI|nr:unnamed protein product [Macrosiphum euphorbiae]